MKKTKTPKALKNINKKRIPKAKLQKNELTFDVQEVKQFIENNPDSKIYLGVDSVRVKKNKVRYACVVCIHYAGHQGAKVFGEISYGEVQDAKLGRPINRMLEEVNKVIELYSKLEDVLIERADDVSIHLDINPDKSAGSSIAYGAAKGMIEGTIGIEPTMKPESFAASFAADRYCNKG